MATTLQGQWDATYGPTVFPQGTPQAQQDATHFAQRVSMAMTTAALAISSEAPATTNHVSRGILSRNVLDLPSQWSAPFAQACASQGLDQSSTDAAISGEMGAIWNGLAGIP